MSERKLRYARTSGLVSFENGVDIDEAWQIYVYHFLTTKVVTKYALEKTFPGLMPRVLERFPMFTRNEIKEVLLFQTKITNKLTLGCWYMGAFPYISNLSCPAKEQRHIIRFSDFVKIFPEAK